MMTHTKILAFHTSFRITSALFDNENIEPIIEALTRGAEGCEVIAAVRSAVICPIRIPLAYWDSLRAVRPAMQEAA